MKTTASEKLNPNNLVLQLFVAGMSRRSMDAIENIKRLCNENLKGHFELEIVDIYKNPQIASEQHIVFCPSLIKCFPLPRRVLIGTLADTKKVMKALGIQFNE